MINNAIVTLLLMSHFILPISLSRARIYLVTSIRWSLHFGITLYDTRIT